MRPIITRPQAPRRKSRRNLTVTILLLSVIASASGLYIVEKFSRMVSARQLQQLRRDEAAIRKQVNERTDHLIHAQPGTGACDRDPELKELNRRHQDVLGKIQDIEREHPDLRR